MREIFFRGGGWLEAGFIEEPYLAPLGCWEARREIRATGRCCCNLQRRVCVTEKEKLYSMYITSSLPKFPCSQSLRGVCSNIRNDVA